MEGTREADRCPVCGAGGSACECTAARCASGAIGLRVLERVVEPGAAPRPPVHLVREYKGQTLAALATGTPAAGDLLPGRIASMQGPGAPTPAAGRVLAGPGHDRGRRAARALPWLLGLWLLLLALVVLHAVP